jgi:hypothetical protein
MCSGLRDWCIEWQAYRRFRSELALAVRRSSTIKRCLANHIAGYGDLNKPIQANLRLFKRCNHRAELWKRLGGGRR